MRAAPHYLVPPEYRATLLGLAVGAIAAVRSTHVLDTERRATVASKLEVAWSLGVAHGARRGVRWAFWAGAVAGAVAALLLAACVGAA